MPRVVGCDPGTSSLDLLLMEDGRVVDQRRLSPDADGARLLEVLEGWRPIDLVAGPSGYGLPLVNAREISERDVQLMSFVRPEECGESVGVGGFGGWVRALVDSDWPVVFLPGAIHLPTIPAWRKVNAVDLGTPDKVCVAALAWHAARTERAGAPAPPFASVEVGSAFTSILVVNERGIVGASSGTNGPVGLRSGGAWDGEAAYALGPLGKEDLFRGGLRDREAGGLEAVAESLRYHLAGCRALEPFGEVWLSGGGLEVEGVREAMVGACESIAVTRLLPGLEGAWVKHAAQGAAMLADGLAGGRFGWLVEGLRLREASGTILDHFWPRRPDWI